MSQEVQSTITALYALAKLGHIDPNNLQPFYVAANECLILQAGWQAVRLVERGRGLSSTRRCPTGSRPRS